MILRDPVHGLVTFESDEHSIVEALLRTREVQRLRGIRQLGLTSLAYPGADHTRFSHAIGTTHVMTRFIARIRTIHGDLPYWQRLTSERAREALAAALLHDVGHGPFSHLFESVSPDAPRHEDWSSRVVLDPDSEVHRVLAGYDPGLPARVEALIHGRHELPYLARAVSGTFDVDRSDYLLRDAHFTGVSYGRFDLDWLLRSFRLGKATDGQPPVLAIDGTKGLPAIESFVLSRLFMFQQVYFHKASRSSELLLLRIFSRATSLLREGVRIAGLAPAFVELAREGETSLGSYLDLDDAAMWTALSAFTTSSDPILSDLSTRLRARRLFKAFELFGEQASPDGQARAVEIVRDIARDAGLDPEHYTGLDVPSVLPFDTKHDPVTVVFPDGSEHRPEDVSFLLGRLRGQVLSRPRVVFAAELRERVIAALGGNGDGTRNDHPGARFAGGAMTRFDGGGNG